MSRKPAPKAKPVVTKTVYDPKTGMPVSSTTVDRNVKAPEAEEKKNKKYYVDKAQFSKQLLTENEDLFKLVEKAIRNKWEMDKFWMEYNKTPFAQARSKAEEEFDIGITGPNADTYQQKMVEAEAKLRQTAERLGLPLTDDEAKAQAKNIVRSGLEGQPALAYDAYFAKKYADQVGGTTGQPGEVASYGTASEIQRQLNDMARSYGLKIDTSLLQKKTGDALGQGERWQEYLSGQQQFFRDQAKLMYPGSAHLFDQYTLEQIAEPYMSEAADLLGLAPSQMDITDPKWSAFLSGENGPLSKDEWSRVLKTDPKYGFDHTTKARQAYTSIGDELLSAFGMA